jgi:hypothetical protein
LAVASGHLHINGIPEQIDKNQLVCTRGATKVYRLAFLEEIGGLVSYQGWDTLDNVAARAKGWEAKIVNVPFEHLKTEGARVGNFVYRHVRNGFYNGTIPFYFPYFLIKIGVKLFKTPLIISSLLMLWGYCKARIIGVKSPYPMYMVSRLRYEQKSFLLKKLKL